MESDIIKSLSRKQNNLHLIPKLLLLPTIVLLVFATVLLHEGRLLNLFYYASYSSVVPSNSANSPINANNIPSRSTSLDSNNLIDVSAPIATTTKQISSSSARSSKSPLQDLSKDDVVGKCDGFNCESPSSSLTSSDNVASADAEKPAQEEASFTPENTSTDDTAVAETIIKFTSNREHPSPGCDIFRGQWVPDPEGPYYTNLTCNMIQEHQNCMKFGRPDTDFLKWRWKPNDCELPRFDPVEFLELVRGKTMAFAGDSLARNHMQSLLCLLSKVQVPEDIETQDMKLKHFFYSAYNFTIYIFWSPFLVKAKELKSEGLWNITLDEIDDRWASRIEQFDYLVISDGNWFTRPSIYYENGQLIGCNYCNRKNTPHITLSYANRRAFKNVLDTINSATRYNGITFFRTYSPSHFEHGEWNKGGNCVRTKPITRDREIKFQKSEAEMYSAQMAEFRRAKCIAEIIGLEFRLLDTTAAMLLRPDGHPNGFGHWPNENVVMYNDCVHWCLPGPIDVWNEMFQEMLWRIRLKERK